MFEKIANLTMARFHCSRRGTHYLCFFAAWCFIVVREEGSPVVSLEDHLLRKSCISCLSLQATRLFCLLLCDPRPTTKSLTPSWELQRVDFSFWSGRRSSRRRREPLSENVCEKIDIRAEVEIGLAIKSPATKKAASAARESESKGF